MGAEALWFAECPICSGKGTIDTIPSTIKGVSKKSSAQGISAMCTACDGTGKIMVVRKFKRKDKD